MARKNGTSHSNGNGHTVADDIADIEREIGQLMHDIEARVGKLQALADAAPRKPPTARPNSSPTPSTTPPTACATAPTLFPTRPGG